MSIAIRSFAKINLGLKIGPLRADGFHELRTVYQTIALHDLVQVDVQPGSGIELQCASPLVPLNQSNTCYKVAERVLKATQAQGKVLIEIRKNLPVQGGLGAASSNGVATLLGLERALGTQLSAEDRLRIAGEVGSDLPLFLVGGTVLGVGRGEEVHPLRDLPTMHLVVVTPPVGVSTPAAFARWDEMVGRNAALTGTDAAGTINKLGQGILDWPSESILSQAAPASEPASGVPAMGGDRAETLLLDLVRAGIENDFERVVFPEYPELREVRRVLEREGARFASLSGSGSALYGLFASSGEAQTAAARMTTAGHAAVATTSLTRDEYWNAMVGG
ncbi:MAG: 4-(cytidine 5'-diphospho)-2-C-methyl-D-erythritol kinase [Candidatus Korobacteraceae bacterium]